MKMICLLGVLIGLMSSSFAFADVGALIQNKYPGIANAPADKVVVDKTAVTLVPLIAPTTKQQSALPYVIVPDDQYVNELGRHHGYANKPENFVQMRGQQTLVLKASDIEIKMKQPATAFLNYPGIAGKPANYIVIDGVTTVLVKKSEYLGYLKRHVGVADLPANYVMENNQVVQVISVDDVEYAPLFFHQIAPQPGPNDVTGINPSAVHDASKNKSVPTVVGPSKEQPSTGSKAGAAK